MFNRKDFLDWAQNAQSNPTISDYQDEINSNKNRHTDSEVSAINQVIGRAYNPPQQNFSGNLKKNELTEEDKKEVPLVSHGPDSSRPVHQQQYTRNTYEKDVPKVDIKGKIKNVADRVKKAFKK